MPGGPVFWQLYQSCISLVVTWSLFFSVFDLQWFIFFYEIRPSRIIRKSKAQLWSWYSSSVIQKIWLHFILGHKTFFNLSCLWLATSKVLDPACPPLGRPAICFSAPNEACLSLRSSETPPPHWPNQPQKKSLAPLVASAGQISVQTGHFINTRQLMN